MPSSHTAAPSSRPVLERRPDLAPGSARRDSDWVHGSSMGPAGTRLGHCFRVRTGGRMLLSFERPIRPDRAEAPPADLENCTTMPTGS